MLGSGTWKPDLTSAVCLSSNNWFLSFVTSGEKSAPEYHDGLTKLRLSKIVVRNKIFYLFEQSFYERMLGIDFEGLRNQISLAEFPCRREQSLTRFCVFIKLFIKLSEVPLFCEAMRRSIFPVQAYESVTMRQGDVVRRVEMTTATIIINTHLDKSEEKEY